jgi:tetratricopeptide (TPR) repeat protein
MTQRKLNWLVSAVAAVAIAGVGSSTFAQVRIDTGNARDANNRIGSGGSNGGGGSRWQPINQNDIVYNNVTAGRGFHGRIQSTDGTSFHGILGSELSGNFIRQSSGAPTGLLSVNNAQQVRSIYDAASKGVNAPPGYIEQGINTGAYVPAPPPTRTSGDLRIGAVNYDDSIAPPRPGETVLPGPVSTSDTNSLITASPLYGVRQWTRDDDQALLNDSTFRTMNDQTLDDQTLQQFRNQLMVPSLPTASNIGQSSKVDNSAATGTLQNAGQSTPNLAQPLNTPLGQQTDKPLPNGQLPGENLANTNVGGGTLLTNQSTQQKLLSTPSQQSAQYQLMEDQLKSYLGQQGYDALQANKQYNTSIARLKAEDEAKMKQAAPLPGAGGPVAPGGNVPGGNALQGQNAGGLTPANGANSPDNKTAPIPTPGPTFQKPAEKPRPLQVHSLAEGIKAQGLKQLMTQAEDQMHQGKWISAIETYQNAVRVAPNQPLVVIGRANAELAATYYVRAEDDLKQAFLSDKKVLMGQYDLRKMIGDDRLAYLLTDLKEMNAKDPKKSTPIFLLAYIAYNTGNEQQASRYLDLLEQRDKDSATLVNTLREFWTLPGKDKAGASATPDMNK